MKTVNEASDATVEAGVAHETSLAHGRAAFVFIFITVALDMLAFGIIAPVLPKLVLEMEGGAFERAARITGYFGFTWAAMQFVSAPVIGALSDRFGRRPVILLSNFGLGLDYVVMALAPSIPWLFIGRVASGITSSSYPTAGAYIADVTPPEQRAAKFGMLSAAFGLGFIVGPAVGGILGDVGIRLPFLVAAALSLLNAAYGFFILPESHPPERRVEVQWQKANPLGALALLRSKPAFLALATAGFLYFVAHESLPSVFVLYATYRYGWTAHDVGVSLALVGVASTVVGVVLVGPVVKRFGERWALVAGLAFFAASVALFGIAPTGTIFLLAIPILALGGFAHPALQALLTRRVGASEQGRLQGALTSMQGVAMMLGPLLFTQIFAAALHVGGASLSGAAFVTAGVLLVAAMALSLRATRATG